MKTLNELNQKVYYRLLKVVFILSFFIITGFAIFDTYSKYLPRIIIDNSKTTILCENGKKINTEKKDIYFTKEKFSEFINDKIQSLCLYDGGWLGYDHNYNIDFAYKSVGGWDKIILLIIIKIISIIIIFELIKRIFYYIILGKAYPNGLFKSSGTKIKKDSTEQSDKTETVASINNSQVVQDEKKSKNPNITKSFIWTTISAVLLFIAPIELGLVAIVISSRYIIKAKKQNEDKKLRKIGNIILIITLLIWLAKLAIWALVILKKTQ